jgi:hypothetical protein
VLGQLEHHRPAGFLLAYGGAGNGMALWRDVGDAQADQIAAAQLAVDAKVEQRQIRLDNCSVLRIAQTCLSRSGGLAPISLPLFQGVRR